MTPALDWQAEDVKLWLQRRGHSSDVISAFANHDVDGRVLYLLTESDLKEMGISRVGPRKRLMAELPRVPTERNGDVPRDDKGDERRVHSTRQIESERWKTVLAFLYMNVVFVITSMVLVIAHERLPDVNSYPPLPDLLLDNMPHVPWAFDAAEGILIILSLLWTAILICHRHRCVILRRVFSLGGTVFLLRSITMLITTLSAPGHHLKTECVVVSTPDWPSKITRAYHIWRNMGMSLGGIKTCGDYMFSGHTVALTLFNFFITEYTPSRWYYLHIFSWLLNIFGIFFILAGHEHYSIDVFVAFYISSRLFLYYHTLANNRSLMIRDLYRTRIWFPLFYFFESGCDGIVPNEYELPVPNFLRSLAKKRL